MRQGKYVLASASVLAVLVGAPLALGAGEGSPFDLGERNPSNNQSQSVTRETELIADTGTYALRESNKSDNGGGAIHGCRSRAGQGNRPCLRSNNISTGRAFEFVSTGGNEAGRIETRDGTGKPFTTNATGVADGLNADRVDGFEGSQIAARSARVTAEGTLGGGRGATSAQRTSEGNYTVVFADDITNCSYTATQAAFDENNGSTAVELQAGTNNTIRVRTRNGGGPEGTGPTNPADKPFHLTVLC